MMRDRVFVLLVMLMLSWCGRDGGRAHGQTRPAAEQLRDIEQVRIADVVNELGITVRLGDNRPGTLVSSAQIRDGRRKAVPAIGVVWPEPEDAGKPTVCFQAFERLAASFDAPGSAHNVLRLRCYNQRGLQKLLEDPAWLAWWNGQPVAAFPSPVADALRQLLTRPRPTPVK